jgi:uncharacterized membrane protein (DUF485 family)
MENQEEFSKINKRLENIAIRMEKLQIAEYINLLNNPKRFLLINLISGIARGLGMAIGFILLGAIMIYILSRLAVLNIPVIGDYITEIVKIVREQL